MDDAATSASLSGCPSTESLNDHYSALAERWQNMTTSNCDRDDETSSPMSPISPVPDCVADREAMDATVRTTFENK